MIRTLVALLVVWVVATQARAQPLALDEDVVEHVRRIRDVNPALRDDAFSKMGGSSVASRAFLHCFATPYVDLGDHPELAETVAYFNTGGSFNRKSDAAGVSWSLRYVLGGRPANFREELAATRARWALVLFGGNDAQNENERVYLQRLAYLVEQLEEMGVVPILGSALPRRNAYKDRWIHRFNLITEAVARHWALPYIDYHGALSALHRKGLARDGVHPNILGQGGLQAACKLTDEGLRYGNNVRNLLTLRMLDALRRAIEEDADRPVADANASTSPGDAGRSVEPDFLPISALVDKPRLPEATSLPKHCGSPAPGSRHYRTQLFLADRDRIRASALDLGGARFRVFWVRVDEEGERCVRRRTETLEVDARPGMWDLIVEVPERAAEQGQMLVLIARDPR